MTADGDLVPDTGRFDLETDVVVVGGGGCGLTAAIAAAKGGAEVLVLEKQGRPACNTARSGGMVPAAGSRFQRAAGIVEPPEAMAEDILRKNGRASDPETTLHLCRVAPALVEWLVDSVGVALEFVGDFKYPAHTEFRMHAPPSRTGAALWADLRRAVAAHPRAELIEGAAVTGLIADDRGAVRGVVAEGAGRADRVGARKVILAANGFAANRAMLERYCPEMAGAYYFGGEGNTGEAIRWGQALGGVVAFMDAYQAHASVAVPHGILITYAVITEGGFQVNRAGRRFGDETTGYSEHALRVLRQPEGLAWNVYDERLHRLALGFEDYRQALAAGAVVAAATAADLAAALGLPARALEETLREYRAAADGVAPDSFGRRDCRRLEPPLRGVRVTGALFHTQGGLRVDRAARVLRADDTPVPNLYAGGGVAAGLSGHGPGGYFSGNGLLTALGYGMLAGRDAARAIREDPSPATRGPR
jgi:fumarate reductase flavoprotein subunit